LIEHTSATTHIKAPRTPTHNSVRHRIASYSQRSQRYVKESQPDYIMPLGLFDDPIAENANTFQQAILRAWKSYQQLADAGTKTETTRDVLLDACATQIICAWDF
jgi:thymidylate synthase (FAD)